MKNLFSNKEGFSLLALMITVVIVVVLSTLTFMWLDPLAQSGNAKDVQRLKAVNVLAQAFKDYSNQNRGTLPFLGSVTTSSKKVLCTTQSGSNISCDDSVEPCLRIADSDFYNNNLFELPIDPDKTSEQDTGYYIQKDNDTGQLIVGACETYGASAITKMTGLKVTCDAYAGGYCWKMADTAAQDCNTVCSALGLACISNITYGPDTDDASSGFCALNLALATSSNACDTACIEGSIVGNYPGSTSCYFDNDSISCTASVTNYFNICPCE